MALLNPTREVDLTDSATGVVATTLLGAGRVGRHVRVPKTAELVAAHLRRQIVRGELVEGDALPPEAVLMEQFGVSRPTLREAFRVLESEALISVRRGAHGGARVHTPNGDVAARYAALVLEHRGTTQGDLHTARTMLEPPAIRLLAEHHTDTDLAVLHTALADTDDAPAELSSLLAHHDRFHSLLIELAGNQTLIVLTGMLRHIIEMTLATNPVAPSQIGGCGSDLEESRRSHRGVVDLIAARDGEKAEDLWRRHLGVAELDQGQVLDLLS
jgi:DNA-binding FadR family transcriptional regulator